MFQVLKSPRSTEMLRIIDLASHIHRSQFRFSNSFGCVSAAALKNKPNRFIRQVFRSKLFWRSKLSALPELALDAGRKGMLKLAWPVGEFNPRPLLFFLACPHLTKPSQKC